MAAPAGIPARRAAHGVAEVYHDKLDILKHASRNVVSTLAETAAKAESKASTFRSHFNIFDVYSTTTNKMEVKLKSVEDEESYVVGVRKDSNCCRRTWAQLRHRTAFLATPPEMWLFLIVLGLFTSFGILFFDSALVQLSSLKPMWFKSTTTVFGGFAVWVGWTVFFTMAAASVGHLISPFADGSGLPQIKSILGGSPLRNFFGWPVMFAKAIGCFFGLAAGLTMGKEGPFAHIAAIACHKLWKLPVFKVIRSNYSMRRQVIAAAVASGTASVMGAPVGALIFSIEVTASFYLVSNLWRGFLCSIVCVFTFSIVHTVKGDFTFTDTTLASGRIVSWEAISFAILGVFAGLLGSAFVYAVSLVLTFRRSFVKNPKRRYIYAAVVGFIIGVLTWCTSYTRVSERDGVNALFEGSNPSGIPKFNIFSSEHNRFISLSVYHVIKFITCVLSITLPIPCGIFLPLMAVSGSFGRLFGEVVGLILENPSEPGLYAVVCAAGMIAGATHTISPCVIIIEITSQANNLMALLIVTVIGYAIAGMFTVSIYDMLIDVSGLPYLPRVQNSRMYDLRAKDVMHPDIHFLTLSSTVSDALNLLTHGRSPYEDSASLPQYPLVESASSMLFLGVVTRDDLETYVASSTRIGRVLKMVRHAEEASSAAPPAPLALTALVSSTLVPHLPALKSAPDVASDIRTGNSSERIGSGSLMMSPAVDAAAGGAGESKQSLTHSMEQQRVDDSELVSSAPDIGLSLTKSPSTASMSSLRAGNSFATPGRSASTQSMPAFASSRPGHHHDAQEDWLHRPLPFDLVPDADTDPEKAVSVDLAPFQVPELMSMPLLHFLFAVCMYSRIYVTHHGKLVGVVYKGDFLDEKWLAPESRI